MATKITKGVPMKRPRSAGEAVATDLVYWGFRSDGEQIPGVLVANYQHAKALAAKANISTTLVRTYVTVHLMEGRARPKATRAKA
jgi:hypothetical protein